MNDLVIHSNRIRAFIRNKYTLGDLDNLHCVLKPAIQLSLTNKNFLRASDRMKDTDPTNYNAVWIRDSMWGYMALLQADRAKAINLLCAILNYLSSDSQLKRLRAVIKNPALIHDSENGSMNVIHVRFDGQSNSYSDVLTDGKPQRWNHKQNDALGLFYQSLIDAIECNLIDIKALGDSQAEVLLRLPTYFDKIKYYEMEDAGSWEEIEKINTSSVALVTSALETTHCHLNNKEFNQSFFKLANKIKLNLKEESLFNGNLEQLIELGYARLFKQLPFESPDYENTDVKYREADAALMNVIYPARLSRLTRQHKEEILGVISKLVGTVGIKRYLNDSYQGANYWISKKAKDETALTGNFSKASDFVGRGESQVPGCEAQWFFDSWLSAIHGQLFRQYGDNSDFKTQIHFFNRALGQLTAGDGNYKVLAADGKSVLPFEFPESYNVLLNHEKSERMFAPSPITPLNWARASMILSLHEMKESILQSSQSVKRDKAARALHINSTLWYRIKKFIGSYGVPDLSF